MHDSATLDVALISYGWKLDVALILTERDVFVSNWCSIFELRAHSRMLGSWLESKRMIWDGSPALSFEAFDSWPGKFKERFQGRDWNWYNTKAVSWKSFARAYHSRSWIGQTQQWRLIFLMNLLKIDLELYTHTLCSTNKKTLFMIPTRIYVAPVIPWNI